MRKQKITLSTRRRSKSSTWLLVHEEPRRHVEMPTDVPFHLHHHKSPGLEHLDPFVLVFGSMRANTSLGFQILLLVGATGLLPPRLWDHISPRRRVMSSPMLVKMNLKV